MTAPRPLVLLALLPLALVLGAAPPQKARPPAPARAGALVLGKTDRILAEHPGGACGLAYSPDGKVVATGGADGLIRLWDPATGKEIRQWSPRKDFLRELCFSPDGKVLASGGNDPRIELWDPATGKEIRKLDGHTGGVYEVAFTPDGKTLVSGGFDEHVRVWDLATGKQKWAARAHGRVVYAVAVSPDGKTLATGGDNDTRLRLWDLSTGKELRSWAAHTSFVYAATFSPDGRWLATGGNDTAAELWEVASGKEVRRLEGHNGGVFRTVFSRDGRNLVTASYHKHIHLWELASGKEVYRLGDHNNWVWNLALAPDGRALASTSDDSTAVLWDLAGRARKGAGPVALTASQGAALWADLGGADAARAYEAVWVLAGDPDRAVATLRDRLKPAPPPARVDEARVTRLIADLDSDEFAVREKATKELDKLGAAALPALKRALVKPPSLEAFRRLEGLVDRHTKGEPPPEVLQGLRAVAVLELAGTPAARALLTKVAGGDPDAVLTLEAKAALERLDRKAVKGG